MTHIECMCGWSGTSETWATHVCWGGGRPLANGIVTPCPECGGRGIEFRGSGKDLQHKTCSRWKEPGHPTETEIRAEFSRMFNAHYPTSGRFG